MRMTTHVMIAAAALLAASPALAQNETDPALNADANAVVTTNDVAAPADNAVMPVDANAVLPTDTTALPVDTTTPAPADDDDRDFPWGVLGLLGLLGLIPRLRRR